MERVNLSAYEVAPAALGRFDFVFMGALALHLRDPARAFSAIRTVVDGDFLSVEVVSLWASLSHPRAAAAALDGVGKPRWWTPNMLGHRRLLESGGFQVKASGGPHFLPFGEGFPPPLRLRELAGDRLRRTTPRDAFFQLVVRRVGAPYAWALARPGV